MAPGVAGTTSAASPSIASSPSDSLIITSPSLSASSLSSSGYDFINVRQHVQEAGGNAGSLSRGVVVGGESSDDEIVWSVSEGEDFEGGANAALLSDDDFVLLSRVKSPVRNPRNARGGRVVERSVVTRSTALALVGGGSDPGGGVGRNGGGDRAANLSPNSANAGTRRDGVSTELAVNLAELSVSAGSTVGERALGDPSGAKTPVRGQRQVGPSGAESNVLKEDSAEKVQEKKKPKKGKKIKQKEESLVVEEEVTAKKNNESRRKAVASSPSVATAPNATPELVRSISVATLVPSPGTTATSVPSDSSALRPEAVNAPTPVQVSGGSSSESAKTPIIAPKPLKGKKKKKKNRSAVTPPEGPYVEEDASTVIAERLSERTESPTAYDEAVNYITSYISNPEAHHDSVCHLTLLQSFIIELGLLTDLTQLPRTIRSAKAFVKSQAFVNIKEYVTKRGQGPEVVRDLMYPSRKALVKDMRKKRNFASLKWVKNRGLQDLLVSAFHR